jgi:hypothetical protein
MRPSFRILPWVGHGRHPDLPPADDAQVALIGRAVWLASVGLAENDAKDTRGPGKAGMPWF